MARVVLSVQDAAHLYWGLAVSVNPSSPVATDSRFSGYLADTRESRRIHHRIRYQVYCERKGFEDNALLRQRGMERDAFDGHAVPFIIKDNGMGLWRGAARLVVRGTTALPLERLGALHEGTLRNCPAGSIAEISRLAALPAGRRGVPQARWDLFRATAGALLSYSACYGIKTLFFLITPSLARVMNRIGFDFRNCGDRIEHRGTRRPYVGDVESALASLRADGYAPTFRNYSDLSFGAHADRVSSLIGQEAKRVSA